ncbi:MAG: ribonuclease H-like domain-containing protein [Flavobacteriales bacterium]|nr:ribonuclease H-like domain-containing protein [Flavobacteriales bacterium]
MNLNLERSIAFFDLETTGLNISRDKIVEIAILKVNADHSEEIYVKRINPGIPISEESVGIHGITDEDVKNEPSFADLADEIKTFIGDADLAGYNSNKFDIPLLLEEFYNVGIELDMTNRRSVDVQTIFHKMEQRTLAAAFQFYCQKDLTDAHSAEADTRATFEILKAQLEKYEEVKNDVDFLQEFSRNGKNKVIDFVGRLAENEKGEVIYNFGKHSGKTVKDVFRSEPGYHRWMLDNDFPLYTKNILKKITDELIAENRKYKQQKAEKEAQRMSNKLDQLKNKFNQ